MRCTGVMPLGISDHCLVYATLKLGSKRPPPKIIRTRNFKNFNAANFKADIEKIPFHILEIFHHKDDALWGWELLFKDICNAHAPFKDVKVRSMSAPWINNTIRHNMNRRFKLFKEANRTKDPSKWAAYKPGGGDTPLFGLYGDVPLDRVWFFGLAVLNRVYNLTCLCPKEGKNLS